MAKEEKLPLFFKKIILIRLEEKETHFLSGLLQ
jgi:hypothetical protein